MKLYLSEHSPLNSVYTNEDGQVLYKVETNIWTVSPISNITCVVPNDVAKGKDDSEISMQDSFAFFGQVKHNVIASSVLNFGGEQFETKDYFRKGGWGPYGRHRAFTGRDGREYKWIMKSLSPKLVINDEAETLVAKFHQKSFGIIGKAHPAILEIHEPWEHMIQEIMVTFIYIEKVRKDRERAAR